MTRLPIILALLLSNALCLAQHKSVSTGKWIDLFNGKDLKNWSVNTPLEHHRRTVLAAAGQVATKSALTSE